MLVVYFLIFHLYRHKNNLTSKKYQKKKHVFIYFIYYHIIVNITIVFLFGMYLSAYDTVCLDLFFLQYLNVFLSFKKPPNESPWE